MGQKEDKVENGESEINLVGAVLSVKASKKLAAQIAQDIDEGDPDEAGDIIKSNILQESRTDE